MAVKTKAFRAQTSLGTIKRHEIVRGIRVTERNMLSVVEWIQKRSHSALQIWSVRNDEKVNPRIQVRTKHGIRVAKPGDFVYFNEDGDVFVGKDDIFEAKFKFVPPTPRVKK